MRQHLLVFACLVAVCLGYSIWPQPVEFIRGQDELTILPDSFKITSDLNSEIFRAAIRRYERAIFPFHTTNQAPGLPVVTSLNISITYVSEKLQLGTSENYTLVVKGSSASISADTIFGAMRGLESFAQLVDYDDVNQWYTISETPIVVNDYPRFPWRGLLIDTGRHYLEVETILTMIDALAYNKMNTLHWHMTDSQSFPFDSTTYPNLSKAGAYAYPQATYTHQDVQLVVQYGFERGIRVVPEFDIPGHSYSWGLGYPELIINCSDAVADWGISAVTLDVTSNYTYNFLDNFLAEITPLFMDSYKHFGSDEVIFQCWNSSTEVLNFMKEKGYTTFPQVEQYFEDQLQILTTKNGIQNRVFWEDAFADNGVTFDTQTTTFEIWLDLDHLAKSVQAGYKSILAMGFYLDVQQPAPVTHYEWVDTWQDFYQNEPFQGVTANLTEAEKALVLGGEACMWGEAVEDENIFSRVWVRASGAAEKLWSPMSFTTNFDVDAAQTRLIEFRCRLKRRGIHATPIRPDYCPLPDGQDL